MSSATNLPPALERNIFYLHMNSSDETIHVSDLGIPMENKMCGLLAVDGQIRLNTANPTASEQRIYLCSDLCIRQSIISGGTNLPILRQLCINPNNNQVHMDIANVIWLETANRTIRNIRLYLKNGNGRNPGVQSCRLNCAILTFPKDN